MIKDVVIKIKRYLDRLAEDKFTGQVVITFRFNQGGIRKTEAEIKHEIK